MARERYTLAATHRIEVAHRNPDISNGNQHHAVCSGGHGDIWACCCPCRCPWPQHSQEPNAWRRQESRYSMGIGAQSSGGQGWPWHVNLERGPRRRGSRGSHQRGRPLPAGPPGRGPPLPARPQKARFAASERRSRTRRPGPPRRAPCGPPRRAPRPWAPPPRTRQRGPRCEQRHPRAPASRRSPRGGRQCARRVRREPTRQGAAAGCPP